MTAVLSVDKEHDQADVLGNDDAASLSSITSLTITESSQSSDRSNGKACEIDVSTLCSQHDVMVSYFNKCFQSITRKLNGSPLATELNHVATLFVKVMDFNDEKKKCFEHTQQSTIKDLEEKISGLESEKENLAVKTTADCKDCKLLKNANDTLNQYIEDSELYHVRQIGELKAKISLTRIEDKLSEEAEICEENSKSSDTAVKTKKNRRSSFKFWKKTSGSSIGVATSPSSKHNDSKLVIDQTMKHELEEKSIKIEELVKYTDDLEKKVSLLQITLQNKDIEANKKEKRIDEIKSQIKSMKYDQSQCYKLLNELNTVLLAASTEVRFLEMEYKAHRQTVARHREQLGAVDWNIKRINEENKIVLSRINKKNYEINLEKLKTEAIVKEMKSFLTNFLQKFKVGKTSIKKEFDRYGLTRLIQISTAFLNNYDDKLGVSPNKNVQHKLIQTSVPESPVICAKDSLLCDPAGNCELKHTMQQNCFNNSQRTDSGLALNDLYCVSNKGSRWSLFHNFDGELCKDHLEEKTAFSKDKENHFLKQNLLRLEKENINLKKGLSASRRGAQVLEKLLNNRKRGSHKTYGTIQKWRERNQETCLPSNSNITSIHTDTLKSDQECLSFDPQKEIFQFTSEGINKDWFHHVEESDSFLHSYEAGSSLIRDILEEKELLEHELIESRLALKHDRQKSPRFL